ncbi:hypothetical protein UT300003_33190 [Clostridium sardiniense]
MLYILDRQEKVIDILKSDGGADFSAPTFFDDTLTQDLQTGAETFTFTTIDKGGVSRNLVAGNYIAFKKKGKYKLFQIMQTEESHEDVIYITVYCESAGLELINKVFRATKIASADQKRFLTTVLADTGWNVGMVDATNEEAYAFDLEDSTVYATLQNNIGKFGVELEFRVEINGGRISQKFVDTYANRGKVTGKRFTFGKDIEKLTRKVDTTSLFTALVGKGKDNLKFSDVTVRGIDKPLGQDFVADQESFDRYNNNGYHIMGIYEFDTTSPEELLRATYKQLQKCKQPKVEYEIEVAMLGELLGEDWNEVEIGDTVTITDTAFNPPITLMARVSKLETSFTNPQNDKCTLANFIEVSSNITDEMRKIASKLEGYVDNSISGKFPIGSDEIKDGAVLGKHIYKNSITTEHLQADSITVDKLDVNYVKAIDGEFKSLKAKTTEIDKAIIKNAEITKAQIDDLIAKDGRFETIISGKADIGTVTAIDGKISQLASIVLTAEDLTAINGDIKNLKSDVANINVVLAEKISTKDLEAINGDIKNLKSQYAEIGIIKSDIANINTVVAGKVSTEELNAVNGNIEKVKSDLIETNKLVSGKASIGELNSVSAEIGKLKVKDGQIDNLLAGNLTASNIKANSITGDKLQAGTITADKIKVGTITAESGILGTACIKTANIGDAQITGAKIANGSIGSANITDGAIISAKIGKAQITGAHIQNATIDDANIKNINADKITAGILDCGRITVRNLSADSITTGSITVLGENLAHNTALRENTNGWSLDEGWSRDTSVRFEGVNSLKCEITGLTALAWKSAQTERVPVNIGDTVVVSAWVMTDGTIPIDAGAGLEVEWYADKTSGRLPNQRGIGIVPTQNNVWQRFVYSTTVDEPNVKYMDLRFHPQKNGKFWVAKPMISKGTIASVWKEHNDELISNGAIDNNKLGDNAVTSNKLNLEELFVSESAFIRNLEAVNLRAEQITTGKISGEVLDLTGLVTFEAFDNSLQNNFVFDTNSNKTYINGGHIYTNSVTADKINAKGLTITDRANMTTFKIDNNGEVYVTGNIQSSNYDEVAQTGYKITKDGDAILNNALIRGDVILPNAGITNYGEMGANKNLLLNSNVITTNKEYNIKNYSAPLLKPNTQYTVVFRAIVPEGKQIGIWFNGGNDGGFLPVRHEGEHTYVHVVNTPTNLTQKSISFYNYPSSVVKSGTILWACLYEGDLKRPYLYWTPSKEDKINPVRFWAGSNYDNRENAPFKVYQDGSIYATKGNFEGTFSGSIDVGNIHISDTNTSQAVFKINTNNDSETKVFLSEEGSYFNTNLVFGTIDKKQVEVDVNNKRVNITDATLKVNRSGNNGWVELGRNGNGYSPMSIGLDKGQYGDYKHDFAFEGGGLVFNNVGARGMDWFDYSFKKKNGTERAKVEIDGTLDVCDDIVLGVMKIAKKTDAGNEGVDFII